MNPLEPSNFRKQGGQDFVTTSKVHFNTDQEVIVTTRDKLKLFLMEHRHATIAKSAWISPVSLLITILIVLLTSEFKKWLLPADTWLAIFVLGLVGATVWSIFAIFMAFSRSKSIDQLLGEIQRASEDKSKKEGAISEEPRFQFHFDSSRRPIPNPPLNPPGPTGPPPDR